MVTIETVVIVWLVIGTFIGAGILSGWNKRVSISFVILMLICGPVIWTVCLAGLLVTIGSVIIGWLNRW
jgi:hypothetical protein